MHANTEKRKDILDDLFGVGKTKALGYLPLHTLKDICQTNIKEIMEFANQNNLHYILYTGWKKGVCDVGSGAIFVYHEEMLSAILIENKKVLKEANVPYRSTQKYVEYIAGTIVDPITYWEAYIVVGKTFNDQRFR